LLVLPNERAVPIESSVHESLLDDADEQPVQSRVNNEVDALLDTVPDLVDRDVAVADLKTRWNPDAKDADVDQADSIGEKISSVGRRRERGGGREEEEGRREKGGGRIDEQERHAILQPILPPTIRP
jgi:hypothetical protein